MDMQPDYSSIFESQEDVAQADQFWTEGQGILEARGGWNSQVAFTLDRYVRTRVKWLKEDAATSGEPYTKESAEGASYYNMIYCGLDKLSKELLALEKALGIHLSKEETHVKKSGQKTAADEFLD